MTMDDPDTPRPDPMFTFGGRTPGKPSRDPFGDAVRPCRSPVERLDRLTVDLRVGAR